MEKTNPSSLSSHCFPETIKLVIGPCEISTTFVDMSVCIAIILTLFGQQYY